MRGSPVKKSINSDLAILGYGFVEEYRIIFSICQICDFLKITRLGMAHERIMGCLQLHR